MSKLRVHHFYKMKQNNEKIVAITAYDSSFSKLFHQQGVEVMLIGDSLGMVIGGQETTLDVSIADITYHTRAVRAGAPDAFVIADMPFMTYPDPLTAAINAAELMRAGANMVKMEGGAWLKETVEHLTLQGIPVCAHIGLLPQQVHVLGGYKIQGRDPEHAKQIINDAQTLERAGALMAVVECIPRALGQKVSQAVDMPIIGIGAGPETDGQILVMHDLLGLNAEYLPKFTHNFLQGNDSIEAAVTDYVQAVKQGAFPAPEHCFE